MQQIIGNSLFLRNSGYYSLFFSIDHADKKGMGY